MDLVSSNRPQEPLVGLRLAAEYLGMSKLTVRRMAHAGQIPAIAFPHSNGKHTYRFRFSELEAFINGLRRPAESRTV